MLHFYFFGELNSDLVTTSPTNCLHKSQKRRHIMWTKPEAIEMRYGFEVTMYVMNR
jgi:coenzyme PQQ precursor peptide PqqA